MKDKLFYFYIPAPFLKDGWNIESKLHLCSQNGGASWVTQTVFWLKKYSSLNVVLTTELPVEGVVISHRCFLPDNLKVSENIFLVCIQADWGRHIFSNYHIVQNAYQLSKNTMPVIYRYFLPMKSGFVHYWPQPNIIPRKPCCSVNRISFFGLSGNLADQLKSENWTKFLAEHGLIWTIYENRSEWNDYSTTDLVVFARDFNGDPHYHKPGTKLYNAWLAGVIPFHTSESAYVFECDSNPPMSVSFDSYEQLKQRISDLIGDRARQEILYQNIDENNTQYMQKSIVTE